MSASLEVALGEAGARLDVVLVSRLEGASRAEIRRLIDAGAVRLNGRRAKKGVRVAAGDRVELAELPTPHDFDARPAPELPLEVVHEDASLVVVNKQAGLPSHPLREAETRTLASALVARYPEMAGVGYARREPGLLHRLDNDTSGLLIAARSQSAFEALLAALREGRIDKRYLALVEGSLTSREPITLPLVKDPRDPRRVRPAREAEAGARPARTEILHGEPRGADTLIEVRAGAALRHQIRAHLAAVGHPLVGDALYGGPTDRLARHFLHASSLAFVHPVSGKSLSLRAPLPGDLAALIAP